MFHKHLRAMTATAGALLAVMVVPAGATTPPVRLRMGQVLVSAAEHLHTIPNELAAFVPTSSHGLCLINLAESNFAISGTTVFCAVREKDGVEGLFIHMFLPEVPPSDAIWILNLYQQGARRYGDPVSCDGGC